MNKEQYIVTKYPLTLITINKTWQTMATTITSLTHKYATNYTHKCGELDTSKHKHKKGGTRTQYARYKYIKHVSSKPTTISMRMHINNRSQ